MTRSTASSVVPAARGRLRARPGVPTLAGARGRHALGLERGRDGLLYVPASVREEHAAPLVVMLHGAGGSAAHALGAFVGHADRVGAILLAPESRDDTWDVIADGDYGADVAFIDRALAHVFARYRVDPERVAVEGFSDGASYALSLGLTNGDLFRHVVAFSPGFMAPAESRGTPRVFISHGTHDRVLPIDPCSRVVVPQLQRGGYDVTYREFDGGHEVPDAIAREALAWWLP